MSRTFTSPDGGDQSQGGEEGEEERDEGEEGEEDALRFPRLLEEGLDWLPLLPLDVDIIDLLAALHACNKKNPAE